MVDPAGPDEEPKMQRQLLTADELAGAQRALEMANETMAADSDLTEDGLAIAFARTRENKYRYVAAWHRWMVWTGSAWKHDDTKAVWDSIRELLRWRAKYETDTEKAAKELRKGQTVAAIERLAQSDRRLAATSDQWDADPWILNTPGGVVDLKTGSLRPHNPEDYLTRITAVSPGGECPRWLRNRATNGLLECGAVVEVRADPKQSRPRILLNPPKVLPWLFRKNPRAEAAA